MSKPAETITYPCGLCSWVNNLGEMVSEQIDPDCEAHKETRCTVCGEVVIDSVTSHGYIGEGGHTVER